MLFMLEEGGARPFCALPQFFLISLYQKCGKSGTEVAFTKHVQLPLKLKGLWILGAES